MKSKKVILTCLIILFLILISILVILYTNSYTASLRNLKKINQTEQIEELNGYTVDLYKLFNTYKGELSAEVISKTYNNLAVNIIPRYYKDCNNLDDAKLEKYYNKNKKVIKVELGIEDFQNFNTFIKYLSENITGSEFEFSSTRVLGASIKKAKEYTEVYVEINYKNNSSIILNSKVYKKILEEMTSITYSTDIDANIIEEDKRIKAEEEESLKLMNSSNQNKTTGKGVPIETSK